MKNSNLLNRLLSYSHEKQKPQRFARYAAMLIMLLALGVGQMWADITFHYLKNMDSKWWETGNSFSMTRVGSSNVYYYVAELEASSNYGLYVKEGSDFYKVNTSTSSNYSKILLYKYTSNNADRVTYTSGAAGKYVFTYDAGDHKIYVSPISSQSVVMHYDVASDHDDWWDLTPTATLNENGSTGKYSVDLTLSATKYYMYVKESNSRYFKDDSKLTVGGSTNLYFYDSNTNNKVNFEPSAAGKYRFTWNHADKSIKLDRLYTITFNNNGGSGSMSDQVVVASTATPLTAKTFTKSNYEFAGWNTEADGTGDSYADGANISATADVTLYAQWKQDLTLGKNGGDSNGSVTVYWNRSDVTGFTEAEKEGYSCDGYYTAGGYKVIAASTGAPTYSSDVSSYINSSGKWINTGAAPSLSAHWTANTYTIKFDKNLNGLTTYVGDVSGTTADKAMTYDESANLTANGYSREGYEFRGWNTSADTTGTRYTDGQSVNNLTATNGGTVTLYAMWKAKSYTVTLDATTNGGSCTVPYITATMGTKYGESVDDQGDALAGNALPDAADYGNYRFIGWYDAAEGGKKIGNDTIVKTDHDHTIYAHYSEITYVYFYKNIEGWGDNVYVIFNANWVDKRGTGRNGGRSFDTMVPVEEGSNIYRYEVPRYALEENWQYNIAFSNSTSEDGNYCINSGKAVYRTDFDSYATMFVPNPTDDTFNPEWENQTTYYSTSQWDWKEGRHKNGYWMKYNPYVYGEAGYVVKGTWDGEVCDFYFRKTEAGNSYTFTKWLPAGQTYDFRIYKHCKTRNTHTSWFIGNSDATITSSITNWTLSTAISQTETTRYDHITTSIAGDYEFKITCNDNGTLSFSVTYPGLTVDDHWYRLLYSWEDAGGSHSRVCETFRRIANGGTEAVDAFIHKASNVSSQSLILQKYVNVSSTPTWSDVQTVDLPSDKITKNGVYSFIVRRPSGSEASCSYVCPYEEDFFLRSDVTAGGWDYYKEIAFKGTQYMTYSDYSARQKTDPYSHYYCQYVSDSSNVAFTIATLTTPSICDTLVGDAIIGVADVAGTKYKHLPKNNPANIRFMYNDSTNTISRAYLKSAQGTGNTRYLVLHGTSAKVLDKNGNTISADGTKSLEANELLFNDNGNWIYEADLQAQPVAKASIKARYNGDDYYLLGGAAEADCKTILGGTASDTKYVLKATYDFKTNRLMVAWTPSNTAINARLANVDMLWVREGDAAATQISFSGSGSLSKVTAVGAIKINHSDVVGRVGSWASEHTRQYAKYFVSFPFDVKVSDIFGLNKASLGIQYVIQKYNGAKRAEKGLFLGDDATFWENLTEDSTMHANEGYLVMFDNDYLNSDSWPIWENNRTSESSIYLYFPATDTIQSISNAQTTTKVAAHQSERTESWTSGGKTYKMSDTDSHWNLIGGPFFHNAMISSSTPGDGQSAFNAYYRYKLDNTWEACVIGDKVQATDVISNTFKAMSCIMVQWHGTLTWNVTDDSPAAPVRRTQEQKNYLIQLDLMYGEDYTDHAFVDLKENADSAFVLCEDMLKIVRNGKPNVYAFAGAYDVAYSQVPVASQTIPLGVIIPQDGYYTFTMPTNFSGTVTLVDSYANTRTNLGLGDYELYLNHGTINDRFFLEFNINQTTTAIDGAEAGQGSLKDGKAHKFIMNDMMYILKDGVLYDARGNRVQ